MADAARIIERIRAKGANVTIDGNKLVIVNRAKLEPLAIAYIRDHGVEIAKYLTVESVVQERAAIMEYDGMLPRAAAEHCARAMIEGLPKDLPPEDRSFYVTAIGRIADEVFNEAYEQARAA